MASLQPRVSAIREGAKHPPLGRVKELTFGVLSASDIRARSVTQVTHSRLTQNGVPVPGGVGDVSMGSSHDNQLCGTCGSEHMGTCTGHEGHIELVHPVINIEFASTVMNVLRCTCYWCGRLLYPDDYLEMGTDIRKISKLCAKRGVCRSHTDYKHVSDAKTRVRKAERDGKDPNDEDLVILYDSVHETSENARHCGRTQPEYYCINGEKVLIGARFTLNEEDYEQWQRGEFSPPEFSPEVIVEILSASHDEDLVRLGLNPGLAHPKNMVWRAMVVPTMLIRPSRGGGIKLTCRSEDALTTLIKEVAKANHRSPGEEANKVRLSMATYVFDGEESASAEYLFRRRADSSLREEMFVGGASLKCAEMYQTLARTVARYQSHKCRNPSKYNSSRAASLREPLERGKEGNVRMLLTGKRCDYVMRSPISVHNHHIHDLCVPIKLCMKVGYPEVVNARNIQDLLCAVRRGPNEYPGANEIWKDDNRVDLSMVDRNNISISIGDVVVRHLIRGDPLMAGRQPTLHRFSVRTLLCRPWDNMTLGIHIMMTSGYNADFDGDEMTVYVLTSEKVRAEAWRLSSPAFDMMQGGSPVVKFVQHAPAGAYMLTKDTEVLSSHRAHELINAWRRDWCDWVNPTEYLHALGDRSYYTGREIFCACLPSLLSVSDIISEGSYVRTAPRMCKKILNGRNGVIASVYHAYGGRKCVDWMSSFNAMLEHYTEMAGVSFTVDDVFLPDDPVTESAKRRCIDLAIREHDGGAHTPMSAFDTSESARREQTIVDILGSARDVVGKRVLEHLGEDASIMISIRSGAKGNPVNAVQNAGAMGQQLNENSSRPPKPLSHHRFSDPVTKYGMAADSFAHGVDACAYYHHQAASQVGLMAMATNLRDSGYGFRKMQKCQEDLATRYDRTVRNSDGDYVMRAFGYHGYSPDQTYAVKIRVRKNGIDWYDSGDCGLTPFSARIRELWCSLLECEDKLKSFEGWDTDAPCGVAYHLEFRRATEWSEAAMTTQQALECERDAGRAWDHMVRNHIVQPTLKVELLFRDWFSAASVYDAGISREVFSRMLLDVVDKHTKASIPPGDSVGNTAAHRLSEPTTQARLNMFHSAGNASKLHGVADVDRIVRASADRTKAAMRVYFSTPKNRIEAEEFALHNLVELEFGNYIRSTATHAHAIPNIVHFSRRLAHVRDGFFVAFEIDRKKCIRDFVTPYDLAEKLESIFLIADTTPKKRIPRKKKKKAADFEEEDVDEVCEVPILPEEDSVCNDVPILPEDEEDDDANTDDDDFGAEEDDVDEEEDEEDDDVDDDDCDEREDMIIIDGTVAVSCSSVWDDTWWVAACVSPANLLAMGVAENVAGQLDIDDPGLLLTPENMPTVLGNIADHVLMENVRGIKGVSEYEISEDDGEMIVVTTGSNLNEVLTLPGVDPSRTVSTCVHDMVAAYGIDTTHTMIVNEVYQTLKNCGTGADIAHIHMMVSRMTHSGAVQSVTERGMRRNNNVMQAISFEKSVENLINAATDGRTDPLKYGSSGAMMLNRLLWRGSGAVRVENIEAPRAIPNPHWDHARIVPIALEDLRRIRHAFVPPKKFEIRWHMRRATAENDAKKRADAVHRRIEAARRRSERTDDRGRKRSMVLGEELHIDPSMISSKRQRLSTMAPSMDVVCWRDEERLVPWCRGMPPVTADLEESIRQVTRMIRQLRQNPQSMELEVSVKTTDMAEDMSKFAIVASRWACTSPNVRKVYEQRPMVTSFYHSSIRTRQYSVPDPERPGKWLVKKLPTVIKTPVQRHDQVFSNRRVMLRFSLRNEVEIDVVKFTDRPINIRIMRCWMVEDDICEWRFSKSAIGRTKEDAARMPVQWDIEMELKNEAVMDEKVSAEYIAETFCQRAAQMLGTVPEPPVVLT